VIPLAQPTDRTPADRVAGRARFLTVAEVAGILRVSTMTVYRLIKAGNLPAVRVGKSYRVREDDVDRYLASSYTQAG
jgi:excisionase family DNA binding protein